MTKLSKTQSILLLAACQRPDRCVLPLPSSLRGGAAQKVVGALLARGMLAEIEAAQGAPAWRRTDGRSVTLVATEAALAALGLESETSRAGESTAPAAPSESDDAAAAQQPPAGRTALQTGKMREGTKQAKLVAMLRRDEGASLAEVVAATGWQPHTVRGALAGALKKRLGQTKPFAEGWLDAGTGEYLGRPVDVAELPDGSILVSDDLAGALYRIWYEPAG